MAADASKTGSDVPDAEVPSETKRKLSDSDADRRGEADRRDEAEADASAAAAAGDAHVKAEKRHESTPSAPNGDAAKTNGVKRPTSDEEAYERVKKHLRELVARKSNVDRELEEVEERLFVEEGAYLQDASAGNVAKGFEHYTKGSQNRRKSLLGEQDRVFSQSSTSFDAEG